MKAYILMDRGRVDTVVLINDDQMLPLREFGELRAQAERAGYQLLVCGRTDSLEDLKLHIADEAEGA